MASSRDSEFYREGEFSPGQLMGFVIIYSTQILAIIKPTCGLRKRLALLLHPFAVFTIVPSAMSHQVVHKLIISGVLIASNILLHSNTLAQNSGSSAPSHFNEYSVHMPVNATLVSTEITSFHGRQYTYITYYDNTFEKIEHLYVNSSGEVSTQEDMYHKYSAIQNTDQLTVDETVYRALDDSRSDALLRVILKLSDSLVAHVPYENYAFISGDGLETSTADIQRQQYMNVIRERQQESRERGYALMLMSLKDNMSTFSIELREKLLAEEFTKVVVGRGFGVLHLTKEEIRELMAFGDPYFEGMGLLGKQ